MKRFLILVFASLLAISSWGLTMEELFSGRYYRDFYKYDRYYSVIDNNVYDIDMKSIFLYDTHLNESYTLNKDGSGKWTGVTWDAVLSFDGVEAKVSTDGEWTIPFKWTIAGNKIHVKLATNFSQKPTNPHITGWYDEHYVESQYQGMKREMNKWYQKVLKEEAEYKAMFGKTCIFEIHEENVEVRYKPNDDWDARDVITRGYMITIEHEGNYVHRIGLRTSPLLDSSSTQSQPSSQTTNASYPYGDEGINKYVKQYIKYPNSVQQNGINAFAYFNLEVGANGKVTSVSCGSSGDIDQQIIEQTKKLLKQLPLPFNPATEDGQKVASTYRVDINYNLEPAIKLAKQSVSFPYSQKEEKIKVTARKDWTFTQPTNSSLSARKEGSYLVISCKARNERDYNEIKDKIIVSTTDNTASYTITLSQAGAPRPFINLEKDQVTIPRDGTARTIEVTSNRQWSVSNPMAEPKIKLYVSPTNITVAASKNRSKNGRSVVYGLVTTDGEYSTSLKVYQNGRLDEKGSYTTSSSSGYGRIYDDYYGYNGRFRITYINARLGVGAPIPEFDEIYVPFNVEAFALRFYMAELSLANFRFDLSLDGFEGIAWEPQLRFLLPANEKVAIMPYIGPTCQMALNGLYNSVWWLSAGAIVRVSWGDFAHSDFSIGYHGGPWGGISMGVSIGFGSGFRK